MNKHKIYFAGSIRGGREDAKIYEYIIKVLLNYGKVLTEHIGNSVLLANEKSLSEKQIHDRDIGWLNESSVLVAEVTQPSLGVGYELCKAMYMNKKVICLFNTSRGTKLSAMIAGQPYFEIINYKNVDEIDSILKNYLS